MIQVHTSKKNQKMNYSLKELHSILGVSYHETSIWVKAIPQEHVFKEKRKVYVKEEGIVFLSFTRYCKSIGISSSVILDRMKEENLRIHDNTISLTIIEESNPIGTINLNIPFLKQRFNKISRGVIKK
ncbi:MAG: hypothetical protein ACTSRU_17400 [Candidatus Hodarchaeales archaeon]